MLAGGNNRIEVVNGLEEGTRVDHLVVRRVVGEEDLVGMKIGLLRGLLCCCVARFEFCRF